MHTAALPSPQRLAGRVYVVHGSTNGLPISPVHNGLGIPNGDVIESPADFASFGAAVITVGDVNADGYADLAVGSPDEDFTSTDSGSLRVFAGSSTGVRSDIILFQGTGDPSTHYGRRVFPAGDINGDARPELLVGQSNKMYMMPEQRERPGIRNQLPRQRASRSAPRATSMATA